MEGGRFAYFTGAVRIARGQVAARLPGTGPPESGPEWMLDPFGSGPSPAARMHRLEARVAC